MKTQSSIVLVNKISEVSRLGDFIDEFCQENEVSQRICGTFSLALDEIVTNIISYGYIDQDEHNINIDLILDQQYLTAAIEDDAIAFNPLEAPEVDTSVPLEDRQIGGLGLHLVKKTMDGLEYKRVDNKNILKLKKKLI